MRSNVSDSNSVMKQNTFKINDMSEFPSPPEAANLKKYLNLTKDNSHDNPSDLTMFVTLLVSMSKTINVIASTVHTVSDLSLSVTVVSQTNSNSTPVQGVGCLSVSDISLVASLDSTELL